MPSGFQQDQNQLTPSYYRVVINMGALGGGSSATWYQMNDNDGDSTTGRITSYSWDNFEGNNLPSTVAIGEALARGNLRFQAIIESIENLADCQILDVENWNNYNADDQVDNGSFAFTVKFDRGAATGANITTATDAVLDGSRQELYAATGAYTFAVTTDGTITMDSTAKALRWQIGQAIGRTGYTKRVRVWDGGNSFEYDDTLTVTLPDSIADLYKDVAVTLVDAAETIDS
jgi:hypothetical protein